MLITMILLIYGLAGLVGNGGASHYVTRFGLDRMVHGLFAAVLIGFLLMSVSFGSLWVFGLGLTAWGLGSFASNSLQQARLVAIDPPMAAASVALNTSSVYLGQAMGAAAGGRLYASGALWAFGPVAALVLLCAVAFSLAGDRSRDKPELASVNS